jgi:hypothetical protein
VLGGAAATRREVVGDRSTRRCRPRLTVYIMDATLLTRFLYLYMLLGHWDVVDFDKTGTLTKGEQGLVGIGG